MDISILIPVYNGEKYLRECIDSCLCQTFNGSYEIIVVNDGSTDSTYDILHSYTDNRIKIFDCEHSGISASLNFGKSKCEGKYIARMDADDIMIIYRLQRQFDFAENNQQYDIIGGQVVFLYNDNKKELRMHKNYEISMHDMLGDCQLYNNTIFYRSELNIKYNSEFDYCEDYCLWLKLLSQGLKIYNMDIPLCVYRQHTSNVSKEFGYVQQYLTIKLRKKYELYDNERVNDNIIVSFTTYKERMSTVHCLIGSIYKGDMLPKKILMTINPEDERYITPKTKAYIDNGIVELNIQELHLRPHLKYYDAVKKYGDKIIITCDDDIKFRNDTISSLYHSYQLYPNCVSGLVVAEPTFDDDNNVNNKKKWLFNIKQEPYPSYSLIAEGVGCILYPPNTISQELLDMEEIQNNFLTEDDLYLKKYEIEHNIKVVFAPRLISSNQRNYKINTDNCKKLSTIENSDGSIGPIKSIDDKYWDIIKENQIEHYGHIIRG